MSTVDIPRAAEILCVDKKRVEELIHSCAIPAAQIGRRYVMLEKDVLEYLTNQIVQQTAARMRKPVNVDERGRRRAS